MFVSINCVWYIIMIKWTYTSCKIGYNIVNEAPCDKWLISEVSLGWAKDVK